MKKYLLIILFFLAFSNSHAQHISFLGISLGQTQETVDKLLRQKGFKYVGEAYEPAHMYEGAFWIYKKVSIMARTHNKKVTEILVTPSKTLYNTKTDVNNLVNGLNKKYGKYCSINDEYNGRLVSYNWAIQGGAIQVTYSPNQTGDLYISLRYIDYSSQLYVNPIKAKNRNTKDDL